MISTMCKLQTQLPILLLVLIVPAVVNAAELSVEVQDSTGKKLTDAVVYLENSKTAGKVSDTTIDVEQKGRQFNPLVSVVQAGASINFPNRDKVRHHVYSFSPAKKFELKLYSGVPTKPVLFDKPGTVVLGCNIHDNMLAFIHIVETPYFAKTNASGVATFSQILEDSYELKVWHYALQTENKPAQQAITIKAGNQPVVIQLEINNAKRL
ncbi:MAG: methylamine utilization protein [Methylophilales bacterium 28-44-11]|nr:MAG: methylamine utilization protein [Methylophilales bacterium 28-44-11]